MTSSAIALATAIALVVAIVVATLPTVSADPPLQFETTFHCNEGHGKWCAAAYFFELDSSSQDDALLYIRFCSKHRSKTVIVDLEPLGGDGALGIFQSHYEVGVKVFHTCSSSARSCTPTTWRYVSYSTTKKEMIENFFHFPHNSYDADSGECEIPSAFVNIEGWFNKPPTWEPFTFFRRDFKHATVWTSQKGYL